MVMSEKDICKEFREAKNPRAQVEILADLNVCSKNEILKVLMASGMDVTAAGPLKPGGDNDKVLQVFYAFFDEIEDEIKAAEKKYLRVVESFKQYGRDQK